MTQKTIQPDAAAGKDSYISDGASADTNYGTAGLALGYRTVTGKNQMSLLQFDLSNIPFNSKIISAILSIYANSTDEGEAGNRTYGIYRNTADWTESTVTWNTAPAISSVYTTTVINANTTGFKDFDVKTLIQEWINKTYSNYGVTIKNATAGQAPNMNYDSSDGATEAQRPKLVINYINQGNFFIFTT